MAVLGTYQYLGSASSTWRSTLAVIVVGVRQLGHQLERNSSSITCNDGNRFEHLDVDINRARTASGRYLLGYHCHVVLVSSLYSLSLSCNSRYRLVSDIKTCTNYPFV